MKQAKRKRLSKAGFRVGTVQEFLGVSDGDTAMIDMKIDLIAMLKSARTAAGLTQSQLAKRIGSSQSRVAKMESASPDVSLELICKALFALGVSRQAIGKTIGARSAA